MSLVMSYSGNLNIFLKMESDGNEWFEDESLYLCGRLILQEIGFAIKEWRVVDFTAGLKFLRFYNLPIGFVVRK